MKITIWKWSHWGQERRKKKDVKINCMYSRSHMASCSVLVGLMENKSSASEDVSCADEGGDSGASTESRPSMSTTSFPCRSVIERQHAILQETTWIHVGGTWIRRYITHSSCWKEDPSQRQALLAGFVTKIFNNFKFSILQKSLVGLESCEPQQGYSTREVIAVNQFFKGIVGNINKMLS